MNCYCQCHRAPDDYWKTVPGADPLEAAVACQQCQHSHCEALLDAKEPNEVLALVPWKDVVNKEWFT